MAVPVLVPLRFIALVSHFVALSTLIWSRTPVVTGCLDWSDGEPTNAEYKSKDVEMVTAICISLICCSIELVGFISGLSLFNNLHCFTSFLGHVLAIFSLVLIVYGRVTCSLIWLIVAAFSVTPATCEVAIIIIYFAIKKET